MKWLKEFWKLNEYVLVKLISAFLITMIYFIFYLGSIAIVVCVIVLVLRAMGVTL